MNKYFIIGIMWFFWFIVSMFNPVVALSIILLIPFTGIILYE